VCDSSVKRPNPRVRDTYYEGRRAVPARGVPQSPVLVGRDVSLMLIGRRLADAAADSGQFLFVAGEAGAGC